MIEVAKLPVACAQRQRLSVLQKERHPPVLLLRHLGGVAVEQSETVVVADPAVRSPERSSIVSARWTSEPPRRPPISPGFQVTLPGAMQHRDDACGAPILEPSCAGIAADSSRRLGRTAFGRDDGLCQLPGALLLVGELAPGSPVLDEHCGAFGDRPLDRLDLGGRKRRCGATRWPR